MNAIVSSGVPHSAVVCCPYWFHKKGLDEMAAKVFKDTRLAIISGDGARLIIKPAKLLRPHMPGWMVDWEVVHSQDENIRGKILFSDEELAAAFGLSGNEGKTGYSLRHKYLLNSAEKGKYGCTGNYLCIPRPDIGLSVYVTEKIRQAIAAILGFGE